MPENDQLVRLSKRMSYALRHDPSSFGLSLASDGSVSVSELIDALNRTKNAHYTAADIDAVMSMPGKRRFALENGRIRAYYGHTVKQEIERSLIRPPEILWHATSHKALDAILSEGLKPMNRQHVHLSSTKETALVAGRRRDDNPPLLEVKALDAWKAGVKFYEGNEDIIMSDPIPARFITVL